MKRDKRFCLICEPKNRTIYFHLDEKSGLPWLFCNKCSRGYSLTQYCDIAGVDLQEYIKDGIDIIKDQDDEVNALSWPSSFIPLSDSRASKGVEYIKSRGLSLDGDIYYDMDEEGIVFPYYYNNTFCGAQIRFVEERIKDDGSKWKITTLPGTRLGLLFYGWNGNKFLRDIRGIIVTEGAFNAISLNQAFNKVYGGTSKNPWMVVACSGSSLSQYHCETLKDLKDKGLKVVGAFDTDSAGLKGINKMKERECITHFALTQDTESDWNDIAKRDGFKELVKLFLSNTQSV